MDLSYYIFRVISWILARLPFAMLYAASDVIYFFLRFVMRYRSNVIRMNLASSFPEKNTAELKKIVAGFYHHLADIIVEIMKLERISPEELKKRVTFRNYHLLEASFEKNRSVLLAIGHCGNWEWMGTALGLIAPHKGYAIVKPLTSSKFHDYMQMLRHRLNPDSTIPFRNAFRIMARLRGQVTLYMIASDQTPTRDEANFWIEFLNQDTPFFLGTEKIARSLDFDVVFIDIQRTGRGKYCGDMQLITDRPSETGELEITSRYIQLLEDAIRKNPANWLWSHRRWKHSRSARND